jgi:hypothetical protein
MIGKILTVFVPVYREDDEGNLDGAWEAVSGSATNTPGLAVTPELTPNGAGFTGLFVITHVKSGLRIGPPHADPDQAHKLADELRQTEATWDQMKPFTPSSDVQRHVEDILGCSCDLDSALEEATPCPRPS